MSLFYDLEEYLRIQLMSLNNRRLPEIGHISPAGGRVVVFSCVRSQESHYGVEDYVFAVTQLAANHKCVREIGKIEILDKTFEERDMLNANTVSSINEASSPWGIQVLRYEIKDITPPASVMEAMEAQMKAERVKRAQILEV